jgi:WD40 repeat protein
MEDPALSPSADDSALSPQIQANGNGNQVIDEVTGGNVFANVTGNVTIPTINNYYYREEPQIPINGAESAEIDPILCPYRGLSNFEPGDAKYFFGRANFVEELVQATQTHSFIPLLGASGSGKSSVILAGLVPKLQEAGRWQFTHFRPGAGEDPFHALALALVPLYTPELNATERIYQARQLAGYFREGTVPLSDVFATIRQNFPTDRVLLIADQFEELYTSRLDEAIRRNFLDKLIAGIAAPTAQMPFAPILVATMRADFLGNALSYRPFADVLQNADLKLGPMNRAELTEVIEKPAKMLGVKFEAGLVERILGDVDKEPGILPLLEFALTELWKQRSNNQLTHAAYGEIGKVQGALTRHADEAIDKIARLYADAKIKEIQKIQGHLDSQAHNKLKEEKREQIQRIFVQLVHPGEGVEDTRQIAMKGDLGQESWSLVEELATERLVVTSRNASDQETVEVVHEALIHNWGELRGWMEIDRGFRSWQERLKGAMRQWQTYKDKDSLLRGAALAEAEEQLLQRPEDLVAQSEFIKLSLREQKRIREDKLEQEELSQKAEVARQKREIRITRGIAGGSLVAVVVSSGLGWMAWKQTRQAEINLADTLSASALSLVDKGKDLDAFILAIRAGKILQNQQISNPSGLNALQEALNHRSEYNRLEGHQSSIWSVSRSPDGKTVASGSWDKTIKIWNLNTGKEIRTLQGHQNYVSSVNFSPDGKILASGGEDKTIKLWNLDTGKEIRTLQGHQNAVISISFSPDGKTLASGSQDKTIKLWNLDTGEEIRTLQGHQNSVWSVSFSPDGKTLASGGGDNTIKLWNPDTGKEIRTLRGHQNSVWSVSFSTDGKTLASGSWDKTIKLWNPDTGKEIRTLQGHQNSIWSVSFSPDDKTLASGSQDSTIKLWNLDTGKEIRTLQGHRNSVSSVSFSTDGKTLASGSWDQTIKLWNLDTAKEIRTFQGHQNSVHSVSFSPDSKILASGGDKTIKLWNLEMNKEIHTLHGHQSMVFSLSFSPDGKTLASGSQDSTIKLWNLDTGKEIRTLQGHQSLVSSVSFSPDAKTLASGSGDTLIKLWNLDTGKEIRTLQGHQNSIWSVSFSPDGKTLASGSKDSTIKLWNLNTGKEIRTLQGHQSLVSSLSFSPSSQTLASGSDDSTIKLWNLDIGKEIRTLQGHQNSVTSVSFSPDDKTLASGSRDNTIKLWNLDTGKEIRTFQGHQHAVFSVSFSPDGKTLASGSQDSTIRLWNRETGWDLEALMGRSCNWVRSYLENNPNVSESDKHLCDGIGTKKQ